ncbi:murein biosynthesis integral membrane protein MurJ [Peptostreptococcus equinus]|uniref:Probable lipid II flippase MurJ n=1 Tax=Peptostreptococcus equinus TaxID=3003601 RepID=A0ABY7JT17_9FIRM|nr:murein biosynthesis integral membrane protein MurJ [Peptostreptococcus sp. CBA3647]WAW15120.1 murein biosynthesis integral membrane protein MurJ [Peptostreptococcus sp. CBA3647]
MKYTAVIIMLITVVARIFGFIREILMSNFYGTSPVTDVVVIALSVPTVILAFISNSLNTSFIPSYSSIRKNSGRTIADGFTSNIANVIAIISIIISILGIIFAEQVVFALASGFKGQTFDLAVDFVRIVLVSATINVVASIYTGYLNIHKSYIIPATRSVIENIILIIFTFVSVYTNVYMLAVGILIATVVENLILIPALIKVGYKHSFKIDLQDKNIRYILMLAVPLMIGIAVDQINVFVDKTLASQIAVGGVATLNYADRINALVYIVITSIITVSYPVLSKFAINKDMANLKKSVFKYAQINLLFCIPIVVAFIIFGKSIVEVIYQRGAFSHDDTIKVSECLAFFSFTMIGASLREIVARTFYCLGDSRTPVKNGMLMVFMNATFSIFLARFIGLKGIALGTSLASLIGTLTLTILLRKKIGKLNTKAFLKNIIKILFISLSVIGIAKLGFNEIKYILETDKALFLTALIASVVYFALIIVANISDSKNIFKNFIYRIKNKI